MELVKPWTHWKNQRERRIFLVVDVPPTEKDKVVLMEVKEYGPEDERSFRHIPYSDWLVLTEEKKLLQQYTPHL